MNSQSFRVRFFIIVLGVIVKFYWGWIEDYMRTIQPYMALASPHGATAEQSVLLRAPSSPATALFYRQSWRSILLAAVTLMAVLSEVLVITLNTIPFTTATAYVAALSSMYVSIGILAAMVGTLAVVLVWNMKSPNREKLPNVPECMADIFEVLSIDASGRQALKTLCEERGRDASGPHRRFALRKLPVAEPGVHRWCIVEVSSA
jgi:magnesium-transporting ATPase (P-type)